MELFFTPFATQKTGDKAGKTPLTKRTTNNLIPKKILPQESKKSRFREKSLAIPHPIRHTRNARNGQYGHGIFCS
jgi:hypothetical protein